VVNEQTREWADVPADEYGDAIVAALTLSGVEYVFFTSGSEIGFFQEAIAKAKAQGRNAPRLITVTHEHASLNAALGYTAVSGKIAATAAHVDVGTQHYGGAVHTALHSGLPVLITAGAPPTSHPGTMRGARDGGGHIWLQQSFDQHGIVRPYVKWDHRLEYQDNPGLIVSRAVQVACTEPCGPTYLTFPREISLLPMKGARFPTARQLGIARPSAPDPDGVREIAERLVRARNPAVVTARSGRNAQTVPALVGLCELLGLPLFAGSNRAYHCFPMDHPLYQGIGSMKDADVILVLEADVPWMPGPDEPRADAYVAVVDVDAAKTRIPSFEFTANLRLTADSLLTIRAIANTASALIVADDRSRFESRKAHWAKAAQARWREFEQDARARADSDPIDPRWVSYNIGQVIDDDCIVLDDTIVKKPLHDYLRLSRPGSYFRNPGSSGGWALGAAFGAKLAAPERDIVAVIGDGFYMFGAANAAIWSAAHYGAPFLTVVYQNRSYSTGVLRIASVYPDGYAARSGYDGGYFDPPIDLAKEAEAAGAYGENVRDPAEVGPALKRGLEQVRSGKPAVISVWLPRLLQPD
jgi:acetolactate synthase-1/2/3 large subunit